MQTVSRQEILDLGAYEQTRPHFRARIMALKNTRRLLVGKHISLAWENHDTVMYQVQEMLRIERITRESDLAHELQTYNQLIPRQSELSATLFVEYPDANERAAMLTKLVGLQQAIFLEVGDQRFQASFAVQDGEEPGRLPAVNYLRFKLDRDAVQRFRQNTIAVNIVIDHPHYQATAGIAGALRDELNEDLRS